MGNLVVPVTRAESFLWHIHSVSKRVPVTQFPALELAARAIKPVYPHPIKNQWKEGVFSREQFCTSSCGVQRCIWCLKLNGIIFSPRTFFPHITFYMLSARSPSPRISCSDPEHTITNQTPGPESRHQKMRKKPLLTTPEKFKSSSAAHTR